MSTGERDPETQLRFGAFREGLQKLGWSEGHNLRIDPRWGEGMIERTRILAAELVALKPDVILGAARHPGRDPLRSRAADFARIHHDD